MNTFVLTGADIIMDNALLHAMMDLMRDAMEKDGLRLIYEERIAPQLASVSCSKTVNRSVTG